MPTFVPIGPTVEPGSCHNLNMNDKKKDLLCNTLRYVIIDLFSYHLCLSCDNFSPQLLAQMTPKFVWRYLIILSRDAVLPIFDIIGG